MIKIKMIRTLFTMMFFFFTTSNIFSQTIEKDTRTLVTLLDYIAKDYPAAVENSTIINEFEYAEMIEFSEKCISIQKVRS